MDKSEISQRWLSIIKSVFHPETTINIKNYKNDIVYEIYWKLISDQNRPNKISRIINIIVPEEQIEDCENLAVTDQLLREHIEYKLRTFNPEHDNLRDIGPPIEKWIIHF